MTLPELKRAWLEAVEKAEDLFGRLEAGDVGCLYLEARATRTPDPSVPGFANLVRRFGSARGAWPQPS